jgi:stage V sporulation protein AE
MRWVDRLADLLLSRRDQPEQKVVIVITDGDHKAAKIVANVARRIDAHFVALSEGNPTLSSPNRILKEVKGSHAEIVLVMADDAGYSGEGLGENLIDDLARSGLLSAVIAVASDTRDVEGVFVDESVTRKGQVTNHAVDKRGFPRRGKVLRGDTVDVLNRIHVPVIGVGDLGKSPSGHRSEQILLEAVFEARRLARRRMGQISGTDDQQDTGVAGAAGN